MAKKKVVTAEQRLKRLIKIRTALLLDEPFFGHLALRLQFKEDSSCATFWVDGVSIGYNPDFADSLLDSHLKGVICHEIMHVVAGHPWRRKGRLHLPWNEACDYAINPLIKDFGFVLPPDVLLDDKFKGKAAEQIYALLQQEKEQQDKQQGNSQATAENKEQEKGGKAKNPSKDENSKEDNSANPPDSDEHSETSKANKGSASADAGKPEQHQPTQATGEVRDCPQENKAEVIEQWQQATLSAAKIAKGRGKLPGSLESFVGEALKPKVDWKEILRRFVEQSHATQDYSWLRPNKSYLAQSLYLPSLKGDQVPCIVAACDTSGSCWGILPQFVAELKSLFEDVSPREMHVVYADTRVTNVQKLHEGDDITGQVRGGGGTSFIPVFDWIEKEGLQPSCLVYLTDTQGQFPQEVPDYPVLWVHPPGFASTPWGELVELSD